MPERENLPRGVQLWPIPEVQPFRTHSAVHLTDSSLPVPFMCSLSPQRPAIHQFEGLQLAKGFKYRPCLEKKKKVCQKKLTYARALKCFPQNLQVTGHKLQGFLETEESSKRWVELMWHSGCRCTHSSLCESQTQVHV
jgi:hypothetical protein